MNKIQEFWFDKLKFCGCGDATSALVFLRDFLAGRTMQNADD